jgi:hypothetical protein
MHFLFLEQKLSFPLVPSSEKGKRKAVSLCKPPAALGSGARFGCGAVFAFLQRAQASLGARLVEHVCEKLLKREQLAH